jgi:hypothetical protein
VRVHPVNAELLLVKFQDCVSAERPPQGTLESGRGRKAV